MDEDENRKTTGKGPKRLYTFKSKPTIIPEQDQSSYLGTAPSCKARIDTTIYLPLLSSSPRKKTTAHVSTFFESHTRDSRSCLNFPSLAASSFGLVQEKFAHDPFKLLVVVLFLNKTKGTTSIPLCERLFTVYPTPRTFATANLNELTDLIRPLGLHNKRAQMLIHLGREWLQNPPEKGKRYRNLHYPTLDDGKDILDRPISDEDSRVAWEIAHLPTVGSYALDSWRIFCRDKLRNVASTLNDLGSLIGEAEEKGQEWTSVLPKDKELRAYLKWRWLRLDYLWDPLDGRKLKVGLEIVKRMENHEMKSFRGYQNPWNPQSSVAEVAPSSSD